MPATPRSERPAPSRESQAFVVILRAADALLRDVEALLKGSGLSQTQYNVLRILRGAGPQGLPCREIARRMITRDPDVTRLLDRLEASGLLTRGREPRDRRVVTSRISAQGLRALKQLDAPIARLHRRQFAHLSPRRLALLVRLIEETRARLTGRGVSRQ